MLTTIAHWYLNIGLLCYCVKLCCKIYRSGVESIGIYAAFTRLLAWALLWPIFLLADLITK